MSRRLSISPKSPARLVDCLVITYSGQIEQVTFKCVISASCSDRERLRYLTVLQFEGRPRCLTCDEQARVA